MQIQTTNSAGVDLVAAEDGQLVSGGIAYVSTGYRYDIAKPAIVFGRSGLAFNHKVDVFNGLIDADYRGEIKVMLQSLVPEGNGIAYRWKAGDRIAQLVILDNVVTAQYFPALDIEREGGFGSTDGKDEGGSE